MVLNFESAAVTVDGREPRLRLGLSLSAFDKMAALLTLGVTSLLDPTLIYKAGLLFSLSSIFCATVWNLTIDCLYYRSQSTSCHSASSTSFLMWLMGRFFAPVGMSE